MSLRFWKRRHRVIRMPIKPGSEDTEIRFYTRFGTVAIVRLNQFTMTYGGSTTAEFVDLSHFMEHRNQDPPYHG